MPSFKTKNQIFELIANNDYRIIGIDGYVGYGKSKLAISLSKELDYSLIHLDKFLEKQDKVYFNNIDFKLLAKDIKKHDKVIIEGILLQKVFSKLNLNPNLLIFCTNDDFIDEWKYYIESNLTFDYLIKERINNINVINNLEGKKNISRIDQFHFELEKYIFDYIPFENADVLYDFNLETDKTSK